MGNLLILYFIFTYFLIVFLASFLGFMLIQLISYRIFNFNLYKFIMKKIEKIMEM